MRTNYFNHKLNITRKEMEAAAEQMDRDRIAAAQADDWHAIDNMAGPVTPDSARDTWKPEDLYIEEKLLDLTKQITFLLESHGHLQRKVITLYDRLAALEGKS